MWLQKVSSVFKMSPYCFSNVYRLARQSDLQWLAVILSVEKTVCCRKTRTQTTTDISLQSHRQADTSGWFKESINTKGQYGLFLGFFFGFLKVGGGEWKPRTDCWQNRGMLFHGKPQQGSNLCWPSILTIILQVFSLSVSYPVLFFRCKIFYGKPCPKIDIKRLFFCFFFAYFFRNIFGFRFFFGS